MRQKQYSPGTDAGARVRRCIRAALRNIERDRHQRVHDFVESIQAEAWCWKERRWAKAASQGPAGGRVDEENEKKDLDELDIAIPVLQPARVSRIQKSLPGWTLRR